MTGSDMDEAQDRLAQNAQTPKTEQASETGGEGQMLDQGAEKTMPAAAQRALMEAEQRRAQAEKADEARQANEVGGAKGPEPTRYGDWEKNGILSDF